MAQPTLSGLELDAGSGGAEVLHDVIDSKVAQAVLVMYSTGDGSGNVVMTDAPLPVDIRADNAGGIVVAALPAGNNNIGNVDIVTLPSGNLGMRAMAASLSVTPASDITDGTYIGDIKVGEALPAGTALLGKVGIDQTTPGTTNAVVEASASAIKTAVELIDNAIDGNYLNVNVNAAGTDLTMNAGVLTAQTQRVTIATDDEVNNLLGTIDADTGAIKTAVEIMDDWDDGSDHCESVLVAGTAEAGFVGVGVQTDYAYDGTTKCTIKRFHVVTSTDDATVIAAPTGTKKIRVLSFSIVALSATVTNVYFQTKTTNTDCFGDNGNPIPIATDADGDNTAGVVLPWNPGGWFETADADEIMAIRLSAAQPVLVCGNYIEVA